MDHTKASIKSQASKPFIWVIGDSVLMDGVANCLEDRMVPNLIRWKSLNMDMNANLRASRPSLIIFEMDTPGSYILHDLLREQPGIHLIGLNQNCNQVIVLNSFKRNTRSLNDLYLIVQEVSGQWEKSREGGSLLDMDNANFR